ncbi:MAG TPA: DUF3618 domain-containing protein [Gemmatimonadaceae bacterium]|nr:DUF3618 domain-containing protein [Gemmatimonadaceae bacterium]
MTSAQRRGLSSDEIRADIEQTRERLGDTVETLGAQLNPSHLAQRVKDNVREATIGRVQHMANRAKENVVDGGRGLANVITENPIPAAMVAAGIGWMLMNRRKEPVRRRYTSEYLREDDDVSTRPNVAQRALSGAAATAEDIASGAQGMARDVAEKAQNVAQDVGQKAQDVAQDVTQKAKTATHRVADRTRATAHRLEDRYDENPIALGAFAVAAGLAIGLAFPSSRKEAELMGSARDQLVDKAKEQLTETTEKVEQVVERAVPKVETAIKEAARETDIRL